MKYCWDFFCLAHFEPGIAFLYKLGVNLSHGIPHLELFFGQKFAFSSYNKFEGIFGPGIAFLMIMVSLEGGSGGFIVLTYMSHLCSLWYINDSHLIFATHSIQSDRQSNTHTHTDTHKNTTTTINRWIHPKTNVLYLKRIL